MKARTILGTLVMMCVLVQVAYAGGKDDLKKYFSDTASKVKATTETAQKREILGNSLQKMSTTLDMVQNSPLISEKDRVSLNHFKTALQEKQDELNGSNGFERVSDTQLNAFSDYIVQDMEQASKTITVTVLTAILIAVIAVLLIAA